MKKKFILFFVINFITFLNYQAGAVPANPNPVEAIQPDGTKITYFLKGDEKVHWMQSLDGYTLLYNNEQFIVYAEKDRDENLVPSKHVYSDKQPYSPEIIDFLSKMPKNLFYSKEQIQTLTQIRKMTDTEKRQAPVIGNKKALCVLMGFTNRPFSKTIEDFENLMNQVGYSSNGARGSVKDFYRENSYGQMDLTVTVVGPYTTQYGATRYVTSNGNRDFAKEAANAANADIDFQEFATDGVLETFHIIFAGYGAENGLSESQYIWSHKWELANPITLDGVKISTYSCSPELNGRSGSTITSIGVVCHELCHVFGADDYYDTDYNSGGGDYPATGEWDLMCMGSWNGPGRDGTSPAHINMFQKILYGWVQPVELTSPKIVTDMPNSAENPVAYIVKPYTNDEQYILENRQKIGFDSYVPGNGLLIYHIHNTAATTGLINNTRHPQQAYVVSASASAAIPSSSVSSYGVVNSTGATFTNASGRDEFSGLSFPQMFRWNGSSGVAVMDKSITAITQSDQWVSFVFKEGFLPVNNLEAVVDYNDVQLSWEQPQNQAQTGYKIYRNGILTGIAENETFSDTGLALGTYQYGVTAVFPEGESEETTVSVTVTSDFDVIFPQVKNLTVATEGKNIVLEWTFSVIDRIPLSFSVVRNDTLLETVENHTYTYTDSIAETGHYDYCVIANYEDEKTSKPVCAEIYFVEEDLPPCLPMTHLDAKVEGETVQLSWIAPANSEKRNYKYTLYLNGEVVQEGIEDTEVDYAVNESGYYHFTVLTYSEDCVLDSVAVHVANIKIVEQPAGMEICKGEKYTLSVAAEPENLLYQWYFKNEAIAGASHSKYTIPEVDSLTTGFYSVVIKDISGKFQMQSDSAEINAKVLEERKFRFLDIPEKLYTNSTYLISAVPDSEENPEDFTYQWSFSNDLITFEPGETPNSIYLITGSQAGESVLSVGIPVDCGLYSVSQELQVDYPLGIYSVPPAEAALYPNPVSEELHIAGRSKIINIIITDLNGRQIPVENDSARGNSQTIRTSHWAKGIYFVRLITEDGTKAYKIVKN
jgi:M6 family metalloprotease-like protein